MSPTLAGTCDGKASAQAQKPVLATRSAARHQSAVFFGLGARGVLPDVGSTGGATDRDMEATGRG